MHVMHVIHVIHVMHVIHAIHDSCLVSLGLSRAKLRKVEGREGGYVKYVFMSLQRLLCCQAEGKNDYIENCFFCRGSKYSRMVFLSLPASWKPASRFGEAAAATLLISCKSLGVNTSCHSDITKLKE
jgi:hypothetical protein